MRRERHAEEAPGLQAAAEERETPSLSPGSSSGLPPVLLLALALALGGWMGSSPVARSTPDFVLPLGALLGLLAIRARFAGRSKFQGRQGEEVRTRPRRLAGLGAVFLLGWFRVQTPEQPLNSAIEVLQQGHVEILREEERHTRLHLAAGPGQENAGSPAGSVLETGSGILREGEPVLCLPGSALTRRPRGFVSPRRDGQDAEVAEQRVHPDQWVRLDSGSGRVPLQAELGAELRAWRMKLAERFLSIDDFRTARLLASISFGLVLEPRRVQRDPATFDGGDADLFTRTGTRHLLAVSGLHVGLMAWMLFGPLSRTIRWALHALLHRRVGEWIADVATLAALALFVTLAGARAPVQRAGLALALVTLAAGLVPRCALARRLGVRRRIAPLSALGTALLIECLVHPTAARSLSVQLSYAATVGLMLWTRPLSAGLRSLFSLSPKSATGLVRFPFWQRPAAKALGLFRDGLAASLAATLATLPFAAHTFGEFSWVGAVATPICLPVFAFLLVGGWLYWLLPLPLLGEALVAGTEALFALLQFFDRWPGTPLQLPPRPFLLVAIACWAAGFALARSDCKGARIAALAGGLCLLPWTAAPGSIEVQALDVGHGTAVLVRAPGEPALVFDAGSRDRPHVADEAVLPQLRAWDPPSVRIVCSHAHRDHASALPRIARRFEIAEWFGASPTQSLRAERARRNFRLIDPIQTGWLRSASRGPWQIHLGRGSMDGEALNESSRDLLLQHRESEQRILLCGDAEAEGRAELLRTLPAGGPIALCLLPHHGTAREQLGPWLDATAPREVWISRGDTAPAEPELDRRGLLWRSTHRDGPLRLRGPLHPPARPDRGPTGPEGVRKAHGLQRSRESE